MENKNIEANNVLSKLIVTVLRSYPQQGLWLFMSVVNSTKHKREKRGRSIIDQLKVFEVLFLPFRKVVMLMAGLQFGD